MSLGLYTCANSFSIIVALHSTHSSMYTSPHGSCIELPTTGPSRCISWVVRAAGNPPPSVDQKAFDLVCPERALLAQFDLVSTRIFRTCSAQPLFCCWVPSLVHEAIPLYLKGFAFLFVEHHEILLDPFLPHLMVTINLNIICSIICFSCNA